MGFPEFLEIFFQFSEFPSSTSSMFRRISTIFVKLVEYVFDLCTPSFEIDLMEPYDLVQRADIANDLHLNFQVQPRKRKLDRKRG